MEDNTEKKASNPDDEISLSAALLAPLNGIFEAQIHAARAFLNFILQMGFRHKYSAKEVEILKQNPEQNAPIIKEIDDERSAKERIMVLEDKKQSEGGLSKAEAEELWSLKMKWDDLYFQKFDFLDSTGKSSSVFIPNLALLPIKPLAVDNAKFKFNLSVTSSSKEYNQMGTVNGADKKRPWYLIDPKSVRGEFAKGESSEKTIQIEVSVSATEMPYGLDKLLTSLTNNVGISNKIDNDS
ncbi:MAG: DUF2589 domain-containing protein [Bacteroidales bacterium]